MEGGKGFCKETLHISLRIHLKKTRHTGLTATWADSAVPHRDIFSLGLN